MDTPIFAHTCSIHFAVLDSAQSASTWKELQKTRKIGGLEAGLRLGVSRLTSPKQVVYSLSLLLPYRGLDPPAHVS
jgi:hypothetical protein